MSRSEQEYDEYGKRILAPLKPTPPLDSEKLAEARKNFLMKAEGLRKDLARQPGRTNRVPSIQKQHFFGNILRTPMLKVLTSAVLVLLIILAGGGLTAYAAQNSLPGDPLYTVKSWSEDVRLSVTDSSEAKLKLILEYTNRRVEEISRLATKGKAWNDGAARRFQSELEDGIQLAASMNDSEMQTALGQIKNQAAGQGMTLEQLINKLPVQAEPAILRLEERLTEQVQLCSYGGQSPQEFRLLIQARQHGEDNPKKVSKTMQPTSSFEKLSATPEPGQNENGNGNQSHQPVETRTHGKPGNGESTPESGNHEPNPTHASKP